MMASPGKQCGGEVTKDDKEQCRQVPEGSDIVVPLPNELDTATKMDALDLSVISCLKLNSLSAARRDAVLMLRTDKKDGRGYIRCGQIELSAGDISAAAQWYEHGLRRVPDSDRLHAYIKEQLRIITVALRPRNPVASLPAEIMEIVLSHLKYRDIVRALRVSRLWAEILPSIRPMSETIDFRISLKVVSAASTNAAFRRVRKSAKALHFANLSEAARGFVKSQLNEYKEYPKVQTLSLTSMESGLWSLPFSKYPLKEIQISDSNGMEMATVVQILKTCKSLVIGKFKNILVPGACYPDVVSVQDFKPRVPTSVILEVLHLDCQAGPMGYINLQASKCFIKSLQHSLILSP